MSDCQIEKEALEVEAQLAVRASVFLGLNSILAHQ